MSSTMTQCILRGPQNQVDTRWIESRLAQKEKQLVVKASGQVWVVVEVGATWPTKRVLDYEWDYVTMPTVSDALTGKDGRRRLPVRPKG